MQSRILMAAFLTALIHLSALPAAAKPKHSNFKDMIARSETIAIVRLEEVPKFEGHKAKLEILETLKGSLKPGKHLVSFSDYPETPAGTGEFVAFLDKDGNWNFSAVPLSTKKVANDVLAVSGFYDSNAHWVTPGLVSLQQLKTYLKDGSLVYKFRGAVLFPQPGKSAWKASNLTITGTYDATKHVAEVKGLPELKGFPTQPEVRVHFLLSDAGIDLMYWRSGDRKLTIGSKVDRLDTETGEYILQCFVADPEVLTEKSFVEYLADAKLGSCIHTFRLQCAPTKEQPEPPILFLTMGKTPSVTGWGKDQLTIGSSSYNGPSMRSGSVSSLPPKKVAEDTDADDWKLRMTAKTATGDYLILVFDLGEPKKVEMTSPGIFRNDLLYAIYSQPIRGTLQIHDGKILRTITTFKVTLDGTHFAPN